MVVIMIGVVVIGVVGLQGNNGRPGRTRGAKLIRVDNEVRS
jgi:hypothetical protein